jgi:hypothetical protein
MSHPVLRILGILFWISLVVGVYAASQSARDPATDAVGVSLVDYFAGPIAKVEALDPSSRLRVHDPVFFQGGDRGWSQVGYVESTAAGADRPIVLSWYSRDVAPEQCRLVQYRNSGRLEEIVATLLSPAKKVQIQQRLAAVMSLHGNDLSAVFVPLVETSLLRSLPVIEAEFRRAVDRHRAEVGQLARRWNDEVVSERLIPLVRREILPIVQTHGQPLADQMGRELWDRASLWRFAWRAIYDKSPLPRKDLLQEEWDRFVEAHAVPVFEAHMDDIVVTIQRIFSDVAATETVRNELAAVAIGITMDREAHRVVREILKETLVKNDRLQEVWRSVWSSEEARRALNLASDRLEPVVRSIGDDLFGTQEEGINPDFARVLRNQILGKDRRWIVAERIDGTGSSAAKTIAVARGSMPYPIVYMAHRNHRGGDAE